MDFSCVRELDFKENILDDYENTSFIIKIKGTYYYDEGDYWTPPSEELEIKSVKFEEDVLINGKIYKRGSEVSDEFLETYADNPNYVDDLEISDIDDDEFIVYEPDYDSIRKEMLLKNEQLIVGD